LDSFSIVNLGFFEIFKEQNLLDSEEKRMEKKSVGSSGTRARPVLKHGPRSLTYMRVQWGTDNPRGRNESNFFFQWE